MSVSRKYKIYLSPPNQSGEELTHLTEVLKANWLAPGGDFTGQFETKLCDLARRKYAVAVNSGTAAIHLALRSVGVKSGDYVICQTFGFVAMSNPIAYLEAIPVFVDSENDTWNMDPELLEKAILKLRKDKLKPAAIIYAHMYGNPAKARELMDIAHKYDIPIIEDAAEALGSKIDGRRAGSFGDVSIFSFNGNKIITTTGGGAILTNREDLVARMRHLASQARDVNASFSHNEIGYNYQMSNLCAALGIAQLPALDRWIEKKREIFNEYDACLNAHGKFTHVVESNGYFSNRWLSVFLAHDAHERAGILDRLDCEGIECRRFWRPLHQLNIYKSQILFTTGVAERLFDLGFCLPSGTGLQPDELVQIKRHLNPND